MRLSQVLPIAPAALTRQLRFYSRRATQAALILSLAAGASAIALPSWAFIRLGLGDSGSEVEQVQRQLRSYGYAVRVDGYFGESTAAAVRDFQTQCGIFVDGVVGEDTYTVLQNGCANLRSISDGGSGGNDGNLSSAGGLSGRLVVMIPTDSRLTLSEVQRFVPEARINRRDNRFGPFIQIAVYNQDDRTLAERQYRYLQRQGFKDAHMRRF